MKLWGGRFSENTDQQADAFHSSLPFDQRLYEQDIRGSIAHAQMLGRQGILSAEDAAAITEALGGILADIRDGTLEIRGAEDIHSFVESVLIARIGSACGRLHTGRSRNDQVALDMRMYTKETIGEIQTLLTALLQALLAATKQHDATIMPGYTHMQKAQPITLAHHLLAYFQMFTRDYDRLSECMVRTDCMPLGAGALAATVYPIDREYVRERLGFAAITANSLDAVSDRDFCIEFVSDLSIIMMHLSRFCEELILWSTDAFGFAVIADAFSTGSSIMPQKKNPDMAELIRGKTGRVYGSLMALLTMMKGLPLAYNKDMQEDKEAVFDAADTVRSCLSVFTGMFESLSFDKENLRDAARGGYINATDAADWLVNHGVPFRNAHEIVGKLVLRAMERKVSLDDLPLEEYQAISEVFDETVFEAISAEAGAEARKVPGGPARSAVAEAIEKAERFLAKVETEDRGV